MTTNPPENVTHSEKAMLLKLRAEVDRVFLEWEKAAVEGRERNSPLNDGCIASINNDILQLFDHVANESRPMLWLQEKTKTLFSRWEHEANQARERNQTLNDNVIGEIKKELVAAFAEFGIP